MNKLFFLIIILLIPVIGNSQTLDAYFKEASSKSQIHDYTGSIKVLTKAIELNPLSSRAYAFDGSNVRVIGQMAKQRIGDLLPYDYRLK
jgi:hypothetical protein